MLGLAVLWWSGRSLAQSPAIYQGRHVAPNEVIVKLRPASEGSLPLIYSAADITGVQPLADGSLAVMRSQTRSVDELIQILAARPEVEYVEPNYEVEAVILPNDPQFGNLWGLFNTGQNIGGVFGTPGADIGAVAAWDISTGSRNNVVGIVDTGIAYTHPDLAANVWTAPSPFQVNIGKQIIRCAAGTHGFNAILKRCDPQDDHNHGTHVAGTIGAIGNNGVGVVGVNWIASLMGLKFLDAGGRGTTADAINAIEFALQAKAAFAKIGGANVRVLSNSWGGGGFSQALLDEINRANQSAVLFVAAAGNDGSNNDVQPKYPASYIAPNVIAVAATDNSDRLAWFSNYGRNTVHLGAPGVNVLSTVRGGGYQYFSGTSMATPHVAGAADLVLSKCPQLTTAELKTALLNSVDVVPALALTTITGGRLNVARAINQCQPTPSCPESISPTGAKFPRNGGAGSFSVMAGPGCNWTATSDASWIIVTPPASGIGNGTVNYSVLPNSLPTSRTGHIRVGDKTFTIEQAAGAQGAVTVVTSPSPPQISFSDAPARVTVNLTSAAPVTGVEVKLSYSGPVSGPTSVMVPWGLATTSFEVHTGSVRTVTNGSITAWAGGSYGSGYIIVYPLTAPPPVTGFVTGFSINPTTVRGGQGATGTITIWPSAPAGGAVVPITYSNGHAYGPDSVTVPYGSTTAAFTINTTPVGYGSYGTLITAGYIGVVLTTTTSF